MSHRINFRESEPSIPNQTANEHDYKSVAHLTVVAPHWDVRGQKCLHLDLIAADTQSPGFGLTKGNCLLVSVNTSGSPVGGDLTHGLNS